MSTNLIADGGSALAALNGVPQVDFPSNLQAAVGAGRRMTSILREVVALRRGPGKLTPNEYFYYRLWDPHLTKEAKQGFVGKQAQHLMHIRCNDAGWYAAAADKLPFHTLMTGVSLPTPQLLAIAKPGRLVSGVPVVAHEAEIAAFLRDRSHYPLFAKPIDGKYSLSVISADDYDTAADCVLLQGGEAMRPAALATVMNGRGRGTSSSDASRSIRDWLNCSGLASGPCA